MRELGHTPDEIPALVEAGMKDPLNFVSVTPEELRGHLEYLFKQVNLSLHLLPYPQPANGFKPLAGVFCAALCYNGPSRSKGIVISMVKVLFICHGNICRSPMAEYLLKEMVRQQGLAAQFQIASAATSREEIGNDVYPPARAELRAHGIPVGHRAAVQVTPRDYDAYDWLLTMDENNARNLRRILPHDPDGKIRPLLSFAGLQRGIADPWYTDDFGTTYDDLVLGCTAFLDALRRRGDI